MTTLHLTSFPTPEELRALPGGISETIIEFDPQVGDRVHVRFYSDVKPGTVVKRTAKFVKVRLDKATIDPSWKPEVQPGGFAGHCVNQHDQKWIISEDLEGRVMTFSDRGIKSCGGWNSVLGQVKHRVWKQSGVQSGCTLGAGWRNFYDYNF